MENTLTIRFIPEKKDYVRASRILSNKSIWFIIFAAVIVLAMLGSLVILAFPHLAPEKYQKTAIILFVVGLFYVLHYFMVIPMQLSRSFTTNEHLRAERVLTFFDSHLRMKIGEHAKDLPWESLKKVYENKGYYLLVFELENEGEVYPYIPERGLEEEDTKQTFHEILQKKTAVLQ